MTVTMNINSFQVCDAVWSDKLLEERNNSSG